MQICITLHNRLRQYRAAGAAAQPGAPMDKGSRQLLNEELKTLGCGAYQHNLEPPCDERERIYRTNLTGIALSGGGIRSASFCLGVLQALAKADLLKRFDYLSTVSGGGYIGASLTWWLSGRWRPNDTEQEYPPQQSTQAHGPGLAEGRRQIRRPSNPGSSGSTRATSRTASTVPPTLPPVSNIEEVTNRQRRWPAPAQLPAQARQLSDTGRRHQHPVGNSASGFAR